jgi:hypothetical protein
MFNSSVLVYNTGRQLKEVEVIEAEGFELPKPNYLIAGLGSEVY